MSVGRLRQVVAAYGADPRRWPERERRAALALVERSAEARACVAEARRLDDELDAAAMPVDPATIARVAARLATDLPPQRQTGGASWATFLLNALMPTWSRGAALASVAVLGILVGLASDPSFLDAEFDAASTTSDTSVMGAFSAWSE